MGKRERQKECENDLKKARRRGLKSMGKLSQMMMEDQLVAEEPVSM